MYRVTLLEKEVILSFKELKNYENTFAYIESLIKQLGKNRKDIVAGIKVLVVKKEDQRSGKLTDGGVVKNILTNSVTHPHGIKVRLVDGTVGRVKEIVLQH